MITAMVMTGHRTNPFDLEGSFTVHFAAEDITAQGSHATATSRGFVLTVDAAAAAIRFHLSRAADGMEVEGRLDCPSLRRDYAASTRPFSSRDRAGPFGRFESRLFWDGARGVLMATWTVPKFELHPGALPSHSSFGEHVVQDISSA